MMGAPVPGSICCETSISKFIASGLLVILDEDDGLLMVTGEPDDSGDGLLSKIFSGAHGRPARAWETLGFPLEMCCGLAFLFFM